MTLSDIENLKKEVLTADDISGYLGPHPQSIREQARRDPKLLGFPVTVCGSRVLIPKEGFVNFCRWGKQTVGNTVFTKEHKEGAKWKTIR